MKIEQGEFLGHQAVTLQTKTSKMVVVTDVGPRIAWFGKQGGRNLLFWDESSPKKSRDEWILRGGHRIWTTRPDGDENEESYAPDNSPCEVSISDSVLLVTAPVDPIYKTQKSLLIRSLDADTFQVENQLRNCGDMLWSGGVWALTCTLPASNTQYGIPLGSGSEWDTFSMVFFRRWGGGHGSRINDPQVSLTEQSLVLNPQGIEGKRMVTGSQGIIGMTDPQEEISFLKHTPYDANGRYPLNCNPAFYVGPDNFMVEMESMSCETTLRPQETKVQTETWGLRPAVAWSDWSQEKNSFP